MINRREKRKIEISDPINDIIDFFGNQTQKVFKRSEIEKIFRENIDSWRIKKSTKIDNFIEYLLDETDLKEIRLEFPYRNEVRYLWGDVSIYEIVLSLKTKSYLTHYTAIYHHGLTDQIPKIIYLNFEQPMKYQRNVILEQERIDTAFKRLVRKSKNIAKLNDYLITILNGKYTGQLGVIEIEGPHNETIRVTNVERTLIDITVRPAYSGGAYEVLNAFRLAKNRASINKLTAMLKKLNYIYPYHQAIGFYLDRAGVYKESQVNLLRKFEMKYDFYLTHNMRDMNYSREWRLYFPKGL